MAGINKVILIGNLGKDPEVRYLEGGIAVAKFPLATSETIKDKNGNKTEHTEWHNVVLWRGLAELAEKFLKKGATIFVEGKIKSRSWEDKEGNKRYITEVVADNMTMLGGKREDAGNNNNHTQAAVHQNVTAPANASTDDLPF